MILDVANFTASDYAAWWGAVIATLALIWNIIVALRSGARIKVTAIPDMKLYPEQPITGDNYYIAVTAVNHGTSSTTITNCCGYHAPSFWSLIRSKKQHFIVQLQPLLGKPIPFKIAPGEEWNGFIEQTDIQEEYKKGYLYIGIAHNQRNSTIYKRVKINA